MQLWAPVRLFPVLANYGTDILRKFFKNIWPDVIKPNSVVGIHAFLITICLIPSIVVKKRATSSQYEMFKWYVAVLILVNCIVVSLAWHSPRFYITLYPLVFIIIVQELTLFLSWVVPKHDRNYVRHSIHGFLLIAGFVGLLLNIIIYVDGSKERKKEIASYGYLNDIIVDNNVIASDVSYELALLFNNVLTIRLPYEPKELRYISKEYISIDYVFFSPRLVKSVTSQHPKQSQLYAYGELYGDYFPFMSSEDFLEEFQFATDFPDGGVLYGRRGK